MGRLSQPLLGTRKKGPRIRTQLGCNAAKKKAEKTQMVISIIDAGRKSGWKNVRNDFSNREIAEMRQTRSREQKLARQQAAKLENLFSQMNRGDVATLNLVLKADVQGSVEAIVGAVGGPVRLDPPHVASGEAQHRPGDLHLPGREGRPLAEPAAVVGAARHQHSGGPSPDELQQHPGLDPSDAAHADDRHRRGTLHLHRPALANGDDENLDSD